VLGSCPFMNAAMPCSTLSMHAELLLSASSLAMAPSSHSRPVRHRHAQRMKCALTRVTCGAGNLFILEMVDPEAKP